MSAIDLISQVTATVEPGLRIEDRMIKYGLDPRLATIRNGIIVEYRGGVDFDGMDLVRLPFRFGKVAGYFWCENNHLTSLVGSPKQVDNTFYCRHNNLKNLVGGPRIVHSVFNCSDNQITTLVGGPERVDSNFFCRENELVSLDGAPTHVGGNFYCAKNPGSAGFTKPVGVIGKFCH